MGTIETIKLGQLVDLMGCEMLEVYLYIEPNKEWDMLDRDEILRFKDYDIVKIKPTPISKERECFSDIVIEVILKVYINDLNTWFFVFCLKIPLILMKIPQ